MDVAIKGQHKGFLYFFVGFGTVQYFDTGGRHLILLVIQLYKT